jgi:hypothetical protein
MVVVSHAATALLVKRCFPQAPMAWILVAAEVPALLWLFAPHLHTVLPLLSMAFAAWVLVGKLLRRRALGAAAAWAILLHVAADLLLHVEPLALAPYADAARFGLTLYETPPLALAAGLTYALLCWLVFGGGKALLAVLVVLAISPVAFGLPPIVEIAAAAALVWYFSRARAAELEHPDRRLARAFA